MPQRAPQQVQARFIDWFYNLSEGLQKEGGFSEKEAAIAVSFMLNKMQGEYGGKRVHVHVPVNATKSSQIRKLWKTGSWTTIKIARHLDVTERWVTKVIGGI